MNALGSALGLVLVLGAIKLAPIALPVALTWFIWRLATGN